MQKIDGLVSVIIPAFNAAAYIRETIESVKQQTYPFWEIIIINDGSQDATAVIVSRDLGNRIRLVNQQNAGVSVARNNGISLASGEYIVFFDADDLMTPEFLSSRVKALEENPELGFVGGLIETFPQKNHKLSAAEDAVNEILFFKKGFNTIPSSYLFRKDVLTKHNIKFNSALSSTADRFLILQIAAVSKGKRLETEYGKVMYRLNEQSMSHKISPALISDNERFYFEIKKAGLLPARRKRIFKAIYFFSLSMGFRKIGQRKAFVKYCVKSFLMSPFQFIKLVFKKR